MPPRKRRQSNAMLYTLIAFVVLFVAAATCAVVFYIKAEDYRTGQADLRRQIAELVTTTERQRLGSIIGAKDPRASWLGTLNEHFDSAIALVAGAVPQNIHAQGKLATAQAQARDALALAARYVDLTNAEPNTVGLTRVIADLKTALDNQSAAADDLNNRLGQLEQRFNDALAATHEKERILLAEKDILLQMVNQNAEDYEKLRKLVEQSADQRIQNALADLEKEKQGRQELNQQLLATQAQLELAEGKIKRAQEQIRLINPPPDANAPALVADGKIILVDYNTKVVHINKGSDDHVYPGLTFAVHDKNAPLPKDGKGKAEIEVFDVRKKFSAARVVSQNPRRPILEGDVIANLIWDAAGKNVFVIAGEFDLDNDGSLDRDATPRLKALIEKWGGKVDEAISVETDFLLLGRQPRTLRKPTFQELEIDPSAMDKYEASVRRRDAYLNIRSQAQALWIPIFTYDRFLHFIGYKQQAANAGAF